MIPSEDEQYFDHLCTALAEINIENRLQMDDLKSSIDQWIRHQPSLTELGILEKQQMAQSWLNRIQGFDFLEPLLHDPEITEIMLNGAGKMFVERGNVITFVHTDVSEERLRQLIQKMVAEVDRRVNQRDPIVDARLKCGARLNVVMPPVGLNGPYLTIRKFRQDLLTLEALQSREMMDEKTAEFLRGAVKSRFNLIISGGTSSGKTTLLNCLSRCIPKGDRVISIEDSAELNLSGIENLVRLETRPGTTGQHLEITMSDLIRTALRMRPDRMVVGEIRGAEAMDMLQALNTGHDGSMSTGHANSATDMLDRIETMALMSRHATSEGVRRQIGSGVHWVIHLKKNAIGKRSIDEIVKVCSGSTGKPQVIPVLGSGFQIVNPMEFEAVRRHA